MPPTDVSKYTAASLLWNRPFPQQEHPLGLGTFGGTPRHGSNLSSVEIILPCHVLHQGPALGGVIFKSVCVWAWNAEHF